MLNFSHKDSNSNRYCYTLPHTELFSGILTWAQQFPVVSYYSSNQYYDKHKSDYSYNKYEFVFGFNYLDIAENTIVKLSQLKKYIRRNEDWLLGYLSYDLKNKFHDLDSRNIDHIGFENLYFFVPDVVVYKKDEAIVLESIKEIDIANFIKEINAFKKKSIINDKGIEIQSRFSKSEYINTVNRIKDDIQYGDVYELNFCQEFFNSNCVIDPLQTFKKLTTISPTPFSAFVKHNSNYLISASPERYITKRAQKIVSQPIKGTIRKSCNSQEDIELIKELTESPKERAENIMIVDLVRNDLSITAKKGTVKVEELCGIYSFKQLHQMISTVSSHVDENKNSVDIIENSFPMGSMTGAPKVRAMQLIEKYEKTKRGLYSGSVGYFSPNGDFDFNVVIRSILYNESNKYLSFTVGSAITIKSDAEMEYEECLLKAQAIRESL